MVAGRVGPRDPDGERDRRRRERGLGYDQRDHCRLVTRHEGRRLRGAWSPPCLRTRSRATRGPASRGHGRRCAGAGRSAAPTPRRSCVRARRQAARGACDPRCVMRDGRRAGRERGRSPRSAPRRSRRRGLAPPAERTTAHGRRGSALVASSGGRAPSKGMATRRSPGGASGACGRASRPSAARDGQGAADTGCGPSLGSDA